MLLHTDQPPGPHSRVAGNHPRERFTAALFDALWWEYRRRVSWVPMYEQLLRMHDAKFQNDHIAFRTLATQEPTLGMHSLTRLFVALGYRSAGAYAFPEKQLSAIHLEHPQAAFPKLFISELHTWELPYLVREGLLQHVGSHRPPLSTGLLETLANLRDENDFAPLLQTLVHYFHTLPWAVPERELVVALNEVNQYAAWVLVHGYNVNHFTALVNAHVVEALDDLEKTAAALRQAGVPMKAEIEGEPESPLRQTATTAVMCDMQVMDRGTPVTLPWPYAYFELAQRDAWIDSHTGRRQRFEGFLGSQATNLFDMTRHGS